jgi:hypothetical protein
MERYFVMGYDASVDRFILLKRDYFESYEDAHEYALECDEGVSAFVVQDVKE